MGGVNERLEVARTALEEEQTKWNSLHLPPARTFFQVDLLHLTARLDALTIVLQDAEIIDKDEYLAVIFEQLVERLADMRPSVTKAVREDQIAARQATLKVGKIYGPNGEVLH